MLGGANTEAEAGMRGPRSASRRIALQGNTATGSARRGKEGRGAYIEGKGTGGGLDAPMGRDSRAGRKAASSGFLEARRGLRDAAY